MERGEQASSRGAAFAPEQAAVLLRRQAALQAEAAAVLDDLRLVDLLSHVGTVNRVGSVATGLS